ncbi:MAG: hypothetical protein HZA94_00420 [Candidatus Vogelbacteria bacterium]|nr:hypothetical protein [Candidatus Vogelbacteria bacterium]
MKRISDHGRRVRSVPIVVEVVAVPVPTAIVQPIEDEGVAVAARAAVMYRIPSIAPPIECQLAPYVLSRLNIIGDLKSTSILYQVSSFFKYLIHHLKFHRRRNLGAQNEVCF